MTVMLLNQCPMMVATTETDHPYPPPMIARSFSSTPPSQTASTPGYRAFREWLNVLLIFALLLAVFHGIYGRFFPTSQGTLGHDCSLAFAGMVDGYIWFAKNGWWEVPWFTPSFCGGQPLFADPQSGYYSVLQWLTFITDPLTASYSTLMLFASLGFFGTYLLARRCFALALPWAILAAALYFFNGFLPHRMIIGHMGYHGLTLAPWMALALLTPVASRVSTIGIGILAGLIAAYWLQSGLTTLMVPAALSVGLVLLVYRLRQPWPRDLFPRISLAVLVSIILSASKLVASLSFYSHFERTQYLLPGFDNPVFLLIANLMALFGPSQVAFIVGYNWLVNSQWTLFPHEWAFGFTLAPLLVLIRARQLARRKAIIELNARMAPGANALTHINKSKKVAIYLVIFTILFLPLAFQFYTPELNEWYKKLPIIGATAAPVRWLIIYLPIVPIATVLLASQLMIGHETRVTKLVAFGIMTMLLFTLIEPRWYYRDDQNYNPSDLLTAYGLLREGGANTHQIRALNVTVDPKHKDPTPTISGNELFIAGISQMHCYNPSFGYRLEKLPLAGLIVGNVFQEMDGKLNIRNPACFVYPEENRCLPGNRFRIDQRDQAEAFISYQPFPFIKSQRQIIADWVTVGGLVFLFMFLVVVWPLSTLSYRLKNPAH